MNSHSSSLTILFISVLHFFAAPTESYSQNRLEILRIVQDSSQTSIAFDARCDGVQEDDLNKANLDVVEDGVPVEDYLLTRQWFVQPEAFSLVFALDISGSMGLYYNWEIPLGAHTLLGFLDPRRDEAAVITVDAEPVLVQSFTSVTRQVYDMIDTVRSGTIAASYDGIYYSAEYCTEHARNAQKAVILITDCEPGSNTHTYSQTFEFAAAHGVRVFVVSFRDVDSTNEFYRFAVRSGGAFFAIRDGRGIETACQKIYQMLRAGSGQYIVTYPSSCRDGRSGKIELRLNPSCGGELRASMNYWRSRDSATYVPATISCGTVFGYAGDSVRIPVWCDAPVMSLIPPFTAASSLDTSVIASISIETGGTQLEGLPTSSSVVGGVVSISSQQRIRIDPSKPLYYIKGLIRPGVQAGSRLPFQFKMWQFFSGCLQPNLIPGEIAILPRGKPYITASGNTVFCEGDTVELTCPEGFRSYRWSNGGQTPSVRITQSGAYWVETEDGSGNLAVSDTIMLLAVQALKPEISNLGADVICAGDHTVLTANLDYPHYRWSNGASTKTIDVTESGEYYLETCNENGCWARSNEISITVQSTLPHSITGPVNMCDTSIVGRYFILPQPGYSYRWTPKRGAIEGAADADTVAVRWNASRLCSVALEARDSATGCLNRSEFFVNTEILNPQLSLSEAVICSSDSIRLSVTKPFERYLWNTGDTTASILVRTTGKFSCAVTDGTCSGATAPAQIICIDTMTVDIPNIDPMCAGQSKAYSVVPIPGASYTWSATKGKVNSSSQYNTCTVEWNEVGSDTLTVSVEYRNCTLTRRFPVQVFPAELLSVRTLGPSTACKGDTIWIEAAGGFVNYSWNTGGQTRTTYVTSPGTYSVVARTVNGCRYTASISVYFNPRPPKPSLVRIGNSLVFQNVMLQCEWFFNDSLLAGEISNSIVLRNPGRYRLRVTDSHGCSSASDEYLVKDSLDSYGSVAVDFHLMPNPNNGRFIVQAEFRAPLRYLITIRDRAGRVVYTEQPDQPVYSIDKTMDLSGLPPGVYLFRMDYGGASIFRKLVIAG